MPNVAVEKNRFILNGISYFRGNADTVELGSYGEKKTPLFGQNYLEVYSKIPIPSTNINKSGVFEIDTTKKSKTTFNGGVKFISKAGVIELDADAAFEQAKNNQLKLVKFNVNLQDMINAANNSQNAIQTLKSRGNDARIVHQIFVVMEATLANQFNNHVGISIESGELKAIITDKELSKNPKGSKLSGAITGEFDNSGTTEVKIPKGTCFAYLLAKIEWDAKLKKRRKKIVYLEDDQWGFN